MKRVGILVGREKSFPEALIENINERGSGNTVADYLKLGGVRHDDPPRYDLVVDRISHEVPFYRASLKRMVLEGTIVINNPFWWSADDKFFNYSLAAKLGVAVPRTVLLPQKDYIPGITDESLRNLEFPLDWQGIIDYVGLPAIMKPFDGGGWKNVSRVNSLEELWAEFDKTGTLCMTLQQFIDFDQFVRCYCIGQDEVMIMPYDPRKPYLSGEQYIHDPNYLEPKLHERVTKDVRTLNRALGYDINTVEFAIKDGVPYAIDFMNPAPDAELISVGAFYHNWVTNAVTDLVFKRLAEARTTQQYRWDAFLNPAPVQTEAVASASEQTNRTVKPGPITGGKKQSAKAAAASEPGATTSAVSSADSSGGKNTAPNSLANDEPKQRTNRRVKSETGTTSERKKSASSSRPKTIS